MVHSPHKDITHSVIKSRREMYSRSTKEKEEKGEPVLQVESPPLGYTRGAGGQNCSPAGDKNETKVHAKKRWEKWLLLQRKKEGKE